jgi:hypothetical protein
MSDTPSFPYALLWEERELLHRCRHLQAGSRSAHCRATPLMAGPVASSRNVTEDRAVVAGARAGSITAFPSRVPLHEHRRLAPARIPSGAPFLAAIPSNAVGVSVPDRPHKARGAPSAVCGTVLLTIAMVRLQTRSATGPLPARMDQGCCAFSSSPAASAE